MGAVTRTAEGKTTQVILTDAQVKALPVTPVLIIPPCGVGKIVFPVNVYLRFKWAANYTNIDAASYLNVSTIGGGYGFLGSMAQSIALEKLSDLLARGDDMDAVLGIFLYNDSTLQNGGALTGYVQNGEALPENAGYQLKINNAAAGALTGGDPANKLIVTAFYNVIDVG